MSRIFQLPRQSPIVGGVVSPAAEANFYLTLTTTRTNTYTDAALTTPSANPVIADAAGVFATIYLDPDIVYRLVLNDTAGALIYDEDPIQDALSQANLGLTFYPRSQAEIDASVTPVNYFKDYGDLARYGAAIDGTTNDTTAVDDWFDVGMQSISLVHSGGASLVTGWTVKPIGSLLYIRGESDAQFTGEATTDFIQPSGGDIDISGIKFDTWREVITNADAGSGTTSSLSVIQSKFNTIADSSIDHERPLDRALIALNSFVNVSDLVVRIGENTFANQLTRKNLQVLFNRFDNIDAASTTSASASLIYGIDVDVIGNIINDMDQTGTGEAWGIYTKAIYGINAFNHIYDIVAAGNSDNTGISLKGTARGLSATPNGIASLTIGNIIRDIGASNVRGIGIRSQADEQYCVFNFIEDAGLIGILFDGVDCNHTSSFYNRIVFTTSTGTIGVSLAQAGTGLRSVGDDIVNAATGIRIATDAISDANDVVVADALIDAVGNAIQTNPSTTNVNGLLISRNVVTAGSVGCQFNGGTLLNNVRLIDNDFRGATTEIGGTIPADIQIRHTFTTQTTNAAATQAISLALPDESAFRVEAKIVAKSADTTERAMYHKTALVYRDAAGSATIQGAVQDTTPDVEVTAGMNGTITVNGNSVRVTVTGIAATTIDWKVELSVLGIG